LTYMSIYDELRYRVNQGDLFLLEAPKNERMVREMYLSDELNYMVNDLENEWGMAVRAYMERFVKGTRIPLRMPSSGEPSAFMSLLDDKKDEVWEIRVRDPEPQLRVFGRFAAKDKFVALRFWTREEVTGKFEIAKEDCKADWHHLFPHDKPFSGRTVYDYASNSFAV